MKTRSPVLGYNHNVRYAGRMWHVQTEDSGVQNPHLFTHLFHDGTILASKKLDYDPTSDVSAVQKLMQSQHKLMLRELKSGAFDPKIEQYFGPIVRDPGDDAEVKVADPAPAPRREATPPAQPVAARAPAVAAPTTAPPPSIAQQQRPRSATLAPARPAVTVNAARSGARLPSAPPPTIGGRSVPPASVSAAPVRPPPPTIGGNRSGVAQTSRPTAEGVIVARPTVIVGQPAGAKQRDAADFWKTERRAPDPAFGGDLISEKSLDEVILAYLSEDAPKK